MTLAEQIELDLFKRLKSGALRPNDLKIVRLAEEYRTSTRPVRSALASLRAKGLPAPDSRKRALPSGNDKPVLATAQSGVEELYACVANDLVAFALSDEEQFVREVHTGEKYGVSTTMVREVFSRLVGEGLLEHIPRRGWKVRQLSQRDLDEFLDVREVLEVRALELAWNQVDLPQFQRFLDGNTLPESPRTKPQIDNAFHREIVRLAGNRYIQEFFNRHGPFFGILFSWEDNDREAAIQAVKQHRVILSAIIARDLPAAKAALIDHIRNNHPVLKSLLAK